MKLIKPSFEILEMSGIKLIEIAGRTCYKSEEKITSDSAGKFVAMLDERQHHAMLEHSFASVRVICDRGVSHEIIRHRLFSYAQESTRYCNYGKQEHLKFIIPSWFKMCLDENKVYTRRHFTPMNDPESTWIYSMLNAEDDYLRLLKKGWTPQQARSVLPNSLKTEIVISGNFREWKHFFKLRCAKEAHPQMQEIAIPIMKEFEKRIPEIIWN